jgi:hypothetical protein
MIGHLPRKSNYVPFIGGELHGYWIFSHQTFGGYYKNIIPEDVKPYKKRKPEACELKVNIEIYYLRADVIDGIFWEFYLNENTSIDEFTVFPFTHRKYFFDRHKTNEES